MIVRDISEEAFDLILEANSDSELKGEDVSEEEDEEEYTPDSNESSSEEETSNLERDKTLSDKLADIREVWDNWVELLPYLYNPGRDVTVDEQLVPLRGRCPFRQYMPSKPARYGLQFWVVCDAKSSYAWKIQLHIGKLAHGHPEKNQGMCIVLDLTEGLRGHNVTCDNFFTSYQLGQQLLKRKITMVGTVRKNKHELPTVMLASKRETSLLIKICLHTHYHFSFVFT
ncbi:unnamed protein product [Lepeophtheirus salmonis]|uniref:(salmon louse) hypothetical protein n=1 Tax=Lepeophtheirus salmonis TaxID=72036 RepID=A0A7R8CGZ3_LEPSM|nr:unnamed protein product [Lepeophtheirus salmonis]CAF2819772.1 unnamed protein product [Lepeophtheirus salmonis]